MKWSVRCRIYESGRMKDRYLTVEAETPQAAIEAARKATPSGWRGGTPTPIGGTPEKIEAKEGA